MQCHYYMRLNGIVYMSDLTSFFNLVVHVVCNKICRKHQLKEGLMLKGGRLHKASELTEQI